MTDKIVKLPNGFGWWSGGADDFFAHNGSRAMSAEEWFEYATGRQMISPADAQAALALAPSEYPQSYNDAMETIYDFHGLVVAVTRACEFGDYQLAVRFLGEARTDWQTANDIARQRFFKSDRR